jgi:hypothetical protein
MKISKVKINNIMSVDQLEVNPGQITVVRGQNAQGKTAVLEAVRHVFRGGTDASILRQGEEEAEVCLVFDNGLQIERSIDAAGKSKVKVRDKVGRIAKPQTFINELIKGLALNPVDFLVAKKADRAKIMIESLSVELTVDQLIKATGLPQATIIPEGLDGPHGLSFIDELHQALYDQRTDTNRSIRDKEGTVRELDESLPPWSEDGDWSQVVEQKNQALEDLGEAERKELEQITQGVSVALEDTTKRWDIRLQAINGQIKELERQYAQVNDEKQKALTDLRTQSVDRRAAVVEDYKTVKEPIVKERIQAQEMVKAEIRSKTTRELMEKTQAEVIELGDYADSLTKALDGLKQLKIDLLENLPIKGVDIKDGEIYVNGIPFDRLPESKKVVLACEVAALQFGDLKLLICDGLERLDASTFEYLSDWVEAHDVQLIAAEVIKEGDLEIVTR